MSDISEFLRDLAGKCRFWSRTTLDLTIADNLRNAATQWTKRRISTLRLIATTLTSESMKDHCVLDLHL
jgi:hypothetical protein